MGELHGKRVLLVEDNVLIGLHLRSILKRAGCLVIGPAVTLEAAEHCTVPFDLATLDIELNGKLVFPFADRLLRRGVPFIFCTGSDRSLLPPHLLPIPVVSKPINDGQLIRALTMVASRVSLIAKPIHDP